MVRYLKIFLILLVTIWGLIGAFGNFAALDRAYDAVHMVTTMPAFPPGEGPPWATDNTIAIWLGVALIVTGKLAAFLFCGYGVIAMLKKAKVSTPDFQHAKRWALLGCGLAVASLFGGFIVIGESFFLMVLDPEAVGAGEAAFRYGGFIALIMIFVAQED